MRVFISVDIEGIACVVTKNDAWSESENFKAARRLMTAEANAAIEGAFAGGAAEVVVADSHGPMDNLLADELHPDAWLIRGQSRAGCMMEGVETGDFGAVMLVGYHAMAGTEASPLAHSFTGEVAALRLNGVAVGEMGFNSAYGGHFGAPTALVAGDDKLAAEVAALLPWAERVIVKHGINYTAARNLTPGKAQQAIRAGAKRAVQRARDGEMKPLKLQTPIRFEVEFKSPLNADRAGVVPGVERLNGVTLAFTGADMVEVNRAWMAMMRLS